MLDQGFVLDLVLLTKQPLHQSPIFSFEGVDPAVAGGEYALREMKFEGERMKYPLMADPLWAGTDDPATVDVRVKKTFWWEPFWISTTFSDKQIDLPFRQDRYGKALCRCLPC